MWGRQCHVPSTIRLGVPQQTDHGHATILMLPGTHYVGQMGPKDMLGKLMRFVTKGVIWDPLPDEVG